jgi:tRNA threonylcarbamoyladenosine biosynthesis protein TsaE
VPVELRSLLRTEGETRALGRHLGTLLRAGDWVALRGTLGSGKTTLVSGIVEAIHPGRRGRSPTYVRVEIYGGAAGRALDRHAASVAAPVRVPDVRTS